MNKNLNIILWESEATLSVDVSPEGLVTVFVREMLVDEANTTENNTHYNVGEEVRFSIESEELKEIIKSIEGIIPCDDK